MSASVTPAFSIDITPRLDTMPQRTVSPTVVGEPIIATTAQTKMVTQQEFPLMKLPLELRLMVYDRLPVEIRQHHFTKNNSIRSHSMGSYSFTIVSKSVNLSILAASRQIYAEATPIIQRKLHDILQTPPRLIIDIISSTKLYKNGGPLWHISRFLAGRAKKAGKSLGTVPYLGTGAGATHERYDPHADPDHARLSHLMDRWFRSLEYQQQTQLRGIDDGYPPIEIGLTAPRNWPHQTVLYALRQLAYVLFAEHGGLRFSLRNAHDLYPTCTDDMRSQERGVIEKVMPGRIGRSSRAIQGCSIDSREFGEDWSNRMYHRGCVH